jgi:hypothetical protein
VITWVGRRAPRSRRRTRWRVRDDALRRAELHDAAVLHDGDPVAEAQRLVQVVRDEHDRLAEVALQLDHLLLHLHLDQRVERAERLVHQHHLGLGGERPRQTDALLHAARELGGAARSPAAEADHVERALGALDARGRVDPLDLEAVGDVVAHAAVRQEPEALEHHGEVARADVAQLLRARRPTSISPSSVSSTTRPAVGGMSRFRQRSSVDLPLPERPMITKNSPRFSRNDTSSTPTTWPVASRMASLLWPCWRSSRADVGLGPKILLRCSARITVSPGFPSRYASQQPCDLTTRSRSNQTRLRVASTPSCSHSASGPIATRAFL